MQCVRCQHPLPPRADRCLRCFALNPQNRPEPLATATPAVPLGAIALKPLGLTFESDPPPKKDALGGLSIRSDPPPKPQALQRQLPDLETPAPAPQTPRDRAQSGRAEDLSEPAFTFAPPEAARGEPIFTPLDGPDLAFGDPSLLEPPRLVIDLNAPRPPPPRGPDTVPSPPPSGMQRAPAAPISLRAQISDGASARVTDPVLPPTPVSAPLPPTPFAAPLTPPVVRLPAPSAAPRDSSPPPRSLGELAQAAIMMSDPGLPMDHGAPLQLKPAPLQPDPRTAAVPVSSPSPDLEGLLPLARPDEFRIVNPRPTLRARLTAWAFDGALIALISALFVALAALQLGGRKLAPLGAQSWESWADGLLFAHRLPILWALLAAALALGYSWLFAALGGRTPGSRIAGLRLLREDGFPLDPLQALLRAALAIPSAALGLFGFVLAFFDPRGQTLHDKLSRSLLVSEESRHGS